MARSDLASAALRHVRDAEHLANVGAHRSLDQALHLAGFASECIRKGCFDDALADKALGHDIRDATDSVVAFLVTYDPDAARYGLGADAAELPERAEKWHPNVRYQRTGHAASSIGATGVGAVVAEARRFVDERVLALFCDGVIGSDVL
jgi:hypothetical protein